MFKETEVTLTSADGSSLSFLTEEPQLAKASTEVNSNNDVIDTLPQLYNKKLALENEFSYLKHKYESELFQIQYEIDSMKSSTDGRTN